MKRLIPSTLLLIFIFFTFGCGQKQETGLTPNFTGNGYSLYVEQTSINTYKFTVVENTNFPGVVFTVYGLLDESQVDTFNPNSRFRLAHVADASNPGDTFEVTFHGDDNFFIIYEDALVGGSFVFDTTNELVRGTFRQ